MVRIGDQVRILAYVLAALSLAAVNFYERGDLFRVVDELNRVREP